MAQEDGPASIAILLLGDPDCGKSTFLDNLPLGPKTPPSSQPGPHSQFRDHFQPTTFHLTIPTRPPQPPKQYRVIFYDPDQYHNATEDSSTSLLPTFVILCYDIGNQHSLESCEEKWRKKVSALGTTEETDTIPIMLLGLKRDVRGKEGVEWVEPQEGHRYAQDLHCDLYAECSAETGELMEEVFQDIVKTVAKTTTEGGGKSEGGSCIIL